MCFLTCMWWYTLEVAPNPQQSKRCGLSDSCFFTADAAKKHCQNGGRIFLNMFSSTEDFLKIFSKLSCFLYCFRTKTIQGFWRSNWHDWNWHFSVIWLRTTTTRSTTRTSTEDFNQIQIIAAQIRFYAYKSWLASKPQFLCGGSINQSVLCLFWRVLRWDVFVDMFNPNLFWFHFVS